MDEEEWTAKDKLLRAKVQLQAKHPFFSYLVMQMKMTERTDLPPYAGVGVDASGNLVFNPDYILEKSHEEVEGILCHEVTHVMAEHLARAGENPQITNIAADLKVNDILTRNRIILPKDGLIPNYDHSFRIGGLTITDIDKKTFEDIYDEINSYFKPPQGSQGGSQGRGGGQGQQQNQDAIDKADKRRWDKHDYNDKGDNEGQDKAGYKKLTNDEMQKVQDKWRQALAEAAQVARQRGEMPAGMDRLVDDLLNTKVSWRHRLYRFITNDIVSDFTWSKPHKKSYSIGAYLPSTTKENIHVVTHIDSSGSINEDDLKDFLSEIVGITKSFNNVSMDLLVGDAKLQDHYEVNNGNISKVLNLKIRGGGGTSHRFVKEWIDENKPDCKLLISLTDGYSDIQRVFPDIKCKKLIALSKHSVPSRDLEDYGEVIRIS
ncbi:hypothetical protein KY320_01545 [Candidatus Woesearchaeota archaeon]|nr:hypothetical protein [Candidatus Woesearchaeota archaeon]